MTETEVPPAIDAVRRLVEIDPGAETIRMVTRISTGFGLAPAQLWPHLTRADHLAAWYGPVQGELEVGGRYEAIGGARGSIVRAAPPHYLELTYEYGNNVDSLVIRLDPEDDGTTKLSLRHTLEVPRELFAQYGPGAGAVGWEIALLGLAAHVDGWREVGITPPTPTPAWLTGEEGAAFVRAWSIRWAAASIAAGTDEQIARRGEQEITRAYGGERGGVSA
ncbi:MAG: SRPBCC domain-containing protein [Brachybacterium sp.]|nr:SRPBCC domain-containing protein [Brachybacterium sp.]